MVEKIKMNSKIITQTVCFKHLSQFTDSILTCLTSTLEHTIFLCNEGLLTTLWLCSLFIVPMKKCFQ